MAKRLLMVLVALILCAALPVSGTRAEVPQSSVGLRFLRSEPNYPDPSATSFQVSGNLPVSFPVRVEGSRLVAAPGSLPPGKTVAVYAAGGDYPLQYLGHTQAGSDGSLDLGLTRLVDGVPWDGGKVWVVVSDAVLPVDRAVNGDFSAGTEGWEPKDPTSQYNVLGSVENGAGKIVQRPYPTPDDTFGQSVYGSLGNLEVLAKLKVPWGEVCVHYYPGRRASFWWSVYHDEPAPELLSVDFTCSVPGLSRGYRDAGGGWWELWARVPAQPGMNLSHMRIAAAPGGWLSSEYGYLDDFRLLDYGMPAWRSPAPTGWQVYAFDGQDFEVADTSVDSNLKYDWYRVTNGVFGVRQGGMKFLYGNYWYRCSRLVPVTSGGRVRLTCCAYLEQAGAFWLEWLDGAGVVVGRSLVGENASGGSRWIVQYEQEYAVPAGACRVRLAINVIGNSQGNGTGWLDHWWLESLAPSP